MKKVCLLLLACAITSAVHAQTNTFPSSGSAGIGTLTPNSSSALEIVSTTQGVLVPRMTKSQRDAITSPATGLLIYQTTNTPAFYYFDGTGWKQITTGTGGANKSLSNLSSPTSVNQSLLPNSNGIFDLGSAANAWKNLYFTGDMYAGSESVLSTEGVLNFFAGPSAGAANTTGSENTFFGETAGFSTDNTCCNSFFGAAAGYSNTSGHSNAFFGRQSGNQNTTGIQNAFFGGSSGYSNTSGSNNAFIGRRSGYNNTTASENTFVGCQAGYENVSGTDNVFAGFNAGYFNVSGSDNALLGWSAGIDMTSGNGNTLIGKDAGDNITTGSNNTLLGYSTSGAAAISNSAAIGYDASVTASDNFVFGNAAVIGWGFGVSPATRAIKVGTSASNGNGAYLTVGGTWTNTSSMKKKEDFQQQDRAAILEKISEMEVTKWKYKGTADEYHYGPMAEDFFRLFETGNDSSTSDMDKTGVLFLGVQALLDMNRKMMNRLTSLEQETAALKLMNEVLNSRLEKMEPGIQEETTSEQVHAYLEQNVPNPFDQSTIISYFVPDPNATVQMQFTSANGEVLKLVELAAGKGSITWKAGELPAGIYQYSLIVNGSVIATRQMMMQR